MPWAEAWQALVGVFSGLALGQGLCGVGLWGEPWVPFSSAHPREGGEMLGSHRISITKECPA